MSNTKHESKHSLLRINSFGEVAAEDEPVLDYFLTTTITEKIIDRKNLLVLGRKGSGKTALVRYFVESDESTALSSAISFKSYPWNSHAKLRDLGASESESHLASWEFFLAVEIAKIVYNNLSDKRQQGAPVLAKFLKANYGTTDPDSVNILMRNSISLSGTLEPTIAGCKIGSITLGSKGSDRLGMELQALSRKILDIVIDLSKAQLGRDKILVHLDELDQGLDRVDEQRSSMLIGLILAARKIRNHCSSCPTIISPKIYLRSDLWEQLSFSDKNKISESSSINIEWNEHDLCKLIELRAAKKLGVEKIEWANLEDGQLMRGSQHKWRHIISRTYLRPRDCIKFCNEALAIHNARSDRNGRFTNKDIIEARNGYSNYLKNELDDEIIPHWALWNEAIDTFSSIQSLVFAKSEFESNYLSRTQSGSPPPSEALEMLFRFNVIAYQSRSGYGGSEWIYRYLRSGSRWDAGATQFRVHPGLKEYCRLKESR